ncbi:hypothetical protein CTB91_01891 [Dickeya solani]|uniref:Uncharacterized protein n=1 Tax=Dickeya solani D s0432-1 TaxID=1231725 RepID=A0AAV3KCZ7_9GAMM|nr:hypothetical protein CTB91_01891 [Dickeya solani]ERO58685.1 hypothetical protein A544_1864 [Dickeya solani D s0432-1]AYQ51872.1 hypothetical protein DSOL99_01896 [Dickeya solani]NUA39874.1 hypothetical protein [Dickeya solani]NUA46000.1 hypothetical protein [Dickeya solani]
MTEKQVMTEKQKGAAGAFFAGKRDYWNRFSLA